MIKTYKTLIVLSVFFNFLLVNAQLEITNKYNLMPWPKEIKENSGKFLINENFTVSISNNQSKKLQRYATKFIRRLTNTTGVFIDEGFPINNQNSSLLIQYDKNVDVVLGIDESYELLISKEQIKINAKTDVGAMRAIETLLQLITYDADDFYFPAVTIKDAPRFIWRGLMIDAARHFQPINVIKRNLDAMASVKMNVFHWHLTDDQGFRVESKVYPKLHELASDGLYYTHNQIKEIVEYATDLGIRVIPEFDVPGHATAILTAYPDLGSKDDYEYKIERFAGVFNPTLNPIKDETYVFLENLFTEIAPLFPDEYFHIGGDENSGKHWDENKKIQQFKEAHGFKTNHDLQTYFNIKLEKILKKLNKKLMGWDEIMTDGIPTTAVIHSWRGTNEGLEQSTLIEAAKRGYQTVLSNGYYIDQMFSVASHYTVDPIGDAILTKEERKNILGAETTMWSELVTPLTIDSRIWPRTAAIAERFWSQKEVVNVDNMYKRLAVISRNLEGLGIEHIKNKKVILRNLTKDENITSIEVLSNICEPLKLYSRNKGGTEYKTFSPFTLFADACTVDAIDAWEFNKIVNQYIEKPSDLNKGKLMYFFDKWITNYTEFKALKSNPNLVKLNKSYASLSELVHIYKDILSNKKNSNQCKSIEQQLAIIKTAFEDVEFAIYDDLENLYTYFKKVKK